MVVISELRTLSQAKWIDVEVKALNEFIPFHSTGETGPSHKQMMFGQVLESLLR